MWRNRFPDGIPVLCELSFTIIGPCAEMGTKGIKDTPPIYATRNLRIQFAQVREPSIVDDALSYRWDYWRGLAIGKPASHGLTLANRDRISLYALFRLNSNYPFYNFTIIYSHVLVDIRNCFWLTNRLNERSKVTGKSCYVTIYRDNEIYFDDGWREK